MYSEPVIDVGAFSGKKSGAGGGKGGAKKEVVISDTASMKSDDNASFSSSHFSYINLN